MADSHLNIAEVHGRFAEEDWPRLWLRLRYFTYKYYRSVPGEIGGFELEDLIMESVVDTLTLKRRMPEGIKLVTFLCGVIRSKVSHLLKSKVRGVPLEEGGGELPGGADALRCRTRQLADTFQQIYHEELCNKIREKVADDEFLSVFVEQWLLDTRQKPAEIAFVLSLSIEQVRLAQRRLKRRLEELRGEVLVP